MIEYFKQLYFILTILYYDRSARMKQRIIMSDSKIIGLASAIAAAIITVALIIMNEALT